MCTLTKDKSSRMEGIREGSACENLHFKPGLLFEQKFGSNLVVTFRTEWRKGCVLTVIFSFIILIALLPENAL